MLDFHPTFRRELRFSTNSFGWHRRLCGYGATVGESQCGAFGVGEVGRLPPGRHREEALVRFSRLLEVAGVHVDAVAAAVDLGRAQVDEVGVRGGKPAFFVAFARSSRDSRASGTTIAGFFIRASTIGVCIT